MAHNCRPRNGAEDFIVTNAKTKNKKENEDEVQGENHDPGNTKEIWKWESTAKRRNTYWNTYLARVAV